MTLADLRHLGAELLLTLIDAPQDIHDRLTSHPGDYLHLTIESIVKWQEFEVYVTNLFAQVVDAGAAVHARLVVGDGHDHRLLLDVVLVLDLADDLLDQVLDGDQAGRAAVLVEHDGDVDLAALE